MLRNLIETRLCNLVAEQHTCEVEWRGAVNTKLPATVEALSGIELLNQYERFFSLKVFRVPHD